MVTKPQSIRSPHFHTLHKGTQKAHGPQSLVRSLRTTISLRWGGSCVPVSEPGIKYQYSGFYTCRLIGDILSQLQIKGFMGPDIISWRQEGRKEGRKGEREGEKIIRIYWVSPLYHRLFKALSLIFHHYPYCVSKQTKAQKDKMMCPRPKSQ